MNRENHAYITSELDVRQGHRLYFLVDNRENISLVKSYKLLWIGEFEPKGRACIKSIEGSIIKTHVSIETWIQEGGIDIPHRLQVVSQQVDLKGDGILGHDFFKLMQAKICYKEHIIEVEGGTELKPRVKTGSWAGCLHS
jgi:hypothetical protein